MCRLRNLALESVTDGRTDSRKKDKVIPMCCYASQAAQKVIAHHKLNKMLRVGRKS